MAYEKFGKLFEVSKRNGKSKIFIDLVDIQILFCLSNKSMKIGDLRDKIKITHANLNTHLERIKPFIDRERDKQSIYLSLNESGKGISKIFEKRMKDIVSKE